MERERFYEATGADSVRPLAGLRVPEATTTWSGPMAGCLLADMGADIISGLTAEGSSVMPCRPPCERSNTDAGTQTLPPTPTVPTRCPSARVWSAPTNSLRGRTPKVVISLPSSMHWADTNSVACPPASTSTTEFARPDTPSRGRNGGEVADVGRPPTVPESDQACGTGCPNGFADRLAASTELLVCDPITRVVD